MSASCLNPAITVRDETEAGVRTISDVTVRAFETLAIGNHTEPLIVEALRIASALTLSRVAEVDGRRRRCTAPLTMDEKPTRST